MKVKKSKNLQTSSALSKAVSNVKQIIKKKDKEVIKKKIVDKLTKSIKEKPLKSINEKPTKSINDKPKKSINEKLKKSTNKKPTKSADEKPTKIINKKSIKITNKKPTKSTDEKSIVTIKKKLTEITNKKPAKSTNDENTIKPFKSTNGVVYIGHIPYGFFENEMKEYFEQFGTVTRVRVARSKKTGKSRGYGYIEFENPDVAKIAADTMNNYLMCGRLLKARYIPPENQHSGFFAGRPWTPKIYPTLTNRIKELKKNQSPLSVRNYKKNVRRSLRQLASVQEQLKTSGVDIKFKPIDLPK